MLPTVIAVLVVAAAVAVWAFSTQRKLVALDENVTNAMNQIGVQLSCRFDALTALVDISRPFDETEGHALSETLKSRRSVITGRSAPEDVLRQEEVIAETLERLAVIVERHPELKTSQPYKKTLGAVETFGNMVRTSRLIYNDSAAKLNREVRMFPVSAVAKTMGLRQREFLGEGAKHSA